MQSKENDYNGCAAHTAGDWIVDQEATATAVGSKHKECIVCGYKVETAQIPATGTTQTGNGEEQTPVPAEKGKVITDEQGSSYKVTKSDATAGEVAFAKPKSGTKGTVKVPDTVTIDGVTYKVTAIEAGAFKNNKNITKVTIGKNVTVIDKNAFSGCTKLKTITVKTTQLKSVGKRACKGIHAKAKIKVPKSRLAKYKRLFKNKGQGKSVKITK